MTIDTTFSEEWRDIKGYYGYQVSSLGRIKSLGNKSNHLSEILMRQSTVLGYKTVGLRKANKSKMLKVHRLVAEAFIPNPKALPQVNHIDGDKTNNSVSNLEWCTAKENVDHARTTGLKQPNKKGKDDPRSIAISQIDPLTGKVVNTFFGLREMERQTGFARANIKRALDKEGRFSYGWKWKRC